MSLWPVGVGIYILGRTTMALGGNLQRYSMVHELAKPEGERRGKLKQPLLVLGLFLFVASGLVLSAALLFAPMSILGPSGVIFIVANGVFANQLNHERFIWKEDGALSLMIIAGVVMCIVAAPKQEKDQDGNIKTFNEDEILDLLAQPTAFIFFGLVVLCVAGFLTAKTCILRKFEHDWEKLALDVRCMTVVSLSYGCIIGALGGFNETVTKSLFATAGGIVSDDGIVGLLSSWIFYLMGFTLLFSFLFQIWTVTKGLEECTALLVLNTQAVVEDCVFGSMGGLLYFQDYHRFDQTGAIVYGFGVLTATSAILALVYIRVRRDRGELAKRQLELQPEVPPEIKMGVVDKGLQDQDPPTAVGVPANGVCESNGQVTMEDCRDDRLPIGLASLMQVSGVVVSKPPPQYDPTVPVG